MHKNTHCNTTYKSKEGKDKGVELGCLYPDYSPVEAVLVGDLQVVGIQLVDHTADDIVCLFILHTLTKQKILFYIAAVKSLAPG